MSDWDCIAAHIADVSGLPFEPEPPGRLGGGCINTAVKLSDGKHSFFVKLNSAHRLDMFEAEAAGLAEIAATSSLRVPTPVCTGVAGEQAYIVMEYIRLGGERPESLAQAGYGLAGMHRSIHNTFGWHRDNTIGSTPQSNGQMGDWARFWREQRLGYQLRLAAGKGYGGSLQRDGERLLEGVAALVDHNPEPSLLHGDLWGGNLGYDADGSPVIYDPAVYYGDREADLAMTELFGGFGARFYAAYQEAWPLDPGYKTRRTLYNLYHILNHLNLFGRGYLGQAQRMIEALLAQLR